MRTEITSNIANIVIIQKLQNLNADSLHVTGKLVIQTPVKNILSHQSPLFFMTIRLFVQQLVHSKYKGNVYQLISAINWSHQIHVICKNGSWKNVLVYAADVLRFRTPIQHKDVVLPVLVETVVRSSYLHNGLSKMGSTTSLFWIGAHWSVCLPDVGYTRIAFRAWCE